jgi:putative endonuclease
VDQGPTWFVYIIQSAVTGRLYTGVTTSPTRRVKEHNESKRGAKATKAGRPWKLVHTEKFDSKGGALRREYTIKKLRRAAKLLLIQS